MYFTSTKQVKTPFVKIIDINEDMEMVSIFLKVDFTTNLKCNFLKNGSPLVTVSNIYTSPNFTHTNIYNVKTSRWKDSGGVTIPEEQRQLIVYIKQEWQDVWEYSGKPEFENGRKKLEPRPTYVEYTNVPIILEINKNIPACFKQEITTEGSSGSTYIVNISDLSCTCPDFTKRRCCYSLNDIRRICKHQARIIIENNYVNKLSENDMIQAFIGVAAGEGKGVIIYRNAFEVEIKEEIKGDNPFIVLMPEENNDWAQVLFFYDNIYDKTGYHLVERRWGRHINPFPKGYRLKYNWVMNKIANDYLLR